MKLILAILIVLFLCSCSKIIINEQRDYTNKNLMISIPDEWITKINNFNKNLLLYSMLSYDQANKIEIYKNNNKGYSSQVLNEIIYNFNTDKYVMDNKRKNLSQKYNKENNSKSTIIPAILTSVDNIAGIQEGVIFTNKDNNFNYYIITIEIPLNSNIYDIILTATSPGYLVKEFEIVKTLKFIRK